MMELDGASATRDDIETLALYNYGHFTSMRVEDGKVRGFSLHLERLAHDARILFKADLDTEHVRQLVRQAAKSVESGMVLRVTVFDPKLELGRPGNASKPRILISGRPAASGPLTALRVKSTRYEREIPDVKHVGLFGTMYERRTAQLAGFDDVLFLDRESYLMEGATWNVGFSDGKEIIWPEATVLPGITMRLVKKISASMEIVNRTERIHISQASDFPHAFITNAAVGVRGIQSIDGHSHSEECPLITALRDAYLGMAGEVI